MSYARKLSAIREIETKFGIPKEEGCDDYVGEVGCVVIVYVPSLGLSDL